MQCCHALPLYAARRHCVAAASSLVMSNVNRAFTMLRTANGSLHEGITLRPCKALLMRPLGHMLICSARRSSTQNAHKREHRWKTSPKSDYGPITTQACMHHSAMNNIFVSSQHAWPRSYTQRLPCNGSRCRIAVVSAMYRGSAVHTKHFNAYTSLKQSIFFVAKAEQQVFD